VYEEVLSEVADVGEGLLAVLAAVGLHVHVCAHVGVQVLSRLEYIQQNTG